VLERRGERGIVAVGDLGLGVLFRLPSSLLSFNSENGRRVTSDQFIPTMTTRVFLPFLFHCHQPQKRRQRRGQDDDNDIRTNRPSRKALPDETTTGGECV